jgi:hypothetical protein
MDIRAEICAGDHDRRDGPGAEPLNIGAGQTTLLVTARFTQTVLPSADTAAMLFWALLASGQINMRKVDGWQTLATNPLDQPIDLAA